MPETLGCPRGMFPVDPLHGFDDFDTFHDLRLFAETWFTGDSHNMPLSWFIGNDYTGEGGTRYAFELVFLMPRMLDDGREATFGLRTFDYQEAEVQQWLDTWVRTQIMSRFGWGN